MSSQKPLKKLFKLCVAAENLEVAKSIYTEFDNFKFGKIIYNHNFHAKCIALIMTYAKPFGKNFFIGRLTHKEVNCKLNENEKKSINC